MQVRNDLDPILGDTITEGTETFTVNLSAPVNATIGDAQAVGTIYDNEGPPALVVLDGSATEAAGPVSLSVIMTSGSLTTQTVDYATSDGSATAGSDYTATSGTLTFTTGQTSKTIPVDLIDDALERVRRDLHRHPEQRDRGAHRRDRERHDLR